MKYKKNILKSRINQLKELLKKCEVCPLKCKVNRLKGEKGVCNTGRLSIVASYGLHFGEESVLVGNRGSGTVFFSNCNLKCVYCQNYDISQLGYGKEVDSKTLSDIFLYLQDKEALNINLVSPTHVVPQIMEALLLAIEKGLSLPIVYNTNGYDNVNTLKLLDGIVDIYMPDIKYGNSKNGYKYSKVKNYFEIVKQSIKEMHRQVGDLVIENGIAKKGLLIRHLVLPSNIADSENVFKFISEEISKNLYINIMNQYRPEFLAYKYKELNREVYIKEYEEIVNIAKKYGLKRIVSN